MPTSSRSPTHRPSLPQRQEERERTDLIPTRESLLSRLKDWEDRESWQNFFETYWRLIYNLARKAGLSDAEAQDIVQETVLSVARKIEGFRYDPKVCSFKSWMLQITRWRIINQLKKRERDNAGQASCVSGSAGTPDRMEEIPDPAGFDLEAIWDEEWEKNLFATALERVKCQVDPAQFQIFDLYCLDEWPVRKVAETLGVSVARIYLAKHRIGRLLRREIAALQARVF